MSKVDTESSLRIEEIFDYQKPISRHAGMQLPSAIFNNQKRKRLRVQNGVLNCTLTPNLETRGKTGTENPKKRPSYGKIDDADETVVSFV